MPDCDPLLLFVNLITVALGTFNVVRYGKIAIALRKSIAAITLFLAAVLATVASGYYAAEWIVYCRGNGRGGEIVTEVRSALGVALLLFSVVQTMILVWRPISFRKLRKGDRK